MRSSILTLSVGRKRQKLDDSDTSDTSEVYWKNDEEGIFLSQEYL